MKKKGLKTFLILLMLVGIGFSVINFFAPRVNATGGSGWSMGKDIVDANGNAISCAPGGSQCMIVTPLPQV